MLIAMDSTSQNRNRVRQNKAMVDQFSSPERPPNRERRAWQQIRRAAARKIFNRRSVRSARTPGRDL
jgi:hypothetical protein